MRPKPADTIPDRAWATLATVRNIIESLPTTIEFPAFLFGIRVDADIAVSNGIPNCHVIAHAIGRVLSLDVHDGIVSVFGPQGERRNLEHSWLTLPDCDVPVIIDPWPLGAVSGPAMYIQNYALHFGPECSFLKHRTEEFLSEVETVVTAINAVLDQTTH